MATKVRTRLFTLGVALVMATGCGSAGDSQSEAGDLAQLQQELGSPYKFVTDIWNLNDLNNMRNDPLAFYRLRAHIDMGPAANWNNGLGWAPFIFRGTLNGNGFQIRNLTMNRPQQWAVGLFSEMSAAVVYDLGLTNVNIQANSMVGGLAGLISGSLVTRTYVEGTVTSTTGAFGSGFHTGLFAGRITDTQVTTSYSRGTVNGDTTSIGGFAGLIDGSSNTGSVIDQCYARVNVTPNSTTSTVKAGGFAAELAGASVTNVYTLGTVQGRGFVGGVFGQISGDNLRFDFAYSRNTVFDWSKPASSGGWAGTYGQLTGNVVHMAGLFWDSTVDGSTNAAGTGQSGLSTTVLKTPTATSQYPYDNGTDEDWNSSVWNCGSSSQYNVLINVVRPGQQLAN